MCVPAIPVFRRLKQENSKFQDVMCDLRRLYFTYVKVNSILRHLSAIGKVVKVPLCHSSVS